MHAVPTQWHVCLKCLVDRRQTSTTTCGVRVYTRTWPWLGARGRVAKSSPPPLPRVIGLQTLHCFTVVKSIEIAIPHSSTTELELNRLKSMNRAAEHTSRMKIETGLARLSTLQGNAGLLHGPSKTYNAQIWF
jgi:hypothetical protein